MVGHWVGLVSHIHLRLYRLYIVLIALVVHIFNKKKMLGIEISLRT